MTGEKSELLGTAQKLVKIMREAHLIDKNDDLNVLINTDYLPVDSFY